MIHKIGNFQLPREVSMALLKANKNSPTILFGAGVVGVVGTVVLASKATLKLSDIVDESAATLDKINTVEHADYSDQDRQKDKVIVYTKTALDITKLYAPAISLGVISVGLLAGSHNILNRRNVALSAAYKGLDKAYREYRERVADEIGIEREQKIWRKSDAVAVIDEDGKKSKVQVHNGTGGSPYKAVFDELNPNWQKSAEYNTLFISGMQNYANDLLRARGYVFLNDVHDLLGIERTKAGQIVGWVWNGDGDNYIDFGVFSNIGDGMRFVKGEEMAIWLDFNVDGEVLDYL